MVRVHPEPRVDIRAPELWQHWGGVHHGVTKVEVPQNGREDSQVEFGIVDLGWEDVTLGLEREDKLHAGAFCFLYTVVLT